MPQKTTLPLGAIMKIPYVGPAIVTGAVVYSVARKVWTLGSQALSARSTKTRAAAPAAADAASTATKTATPMAPPPSPGSGESTHPNPEFIETVLATPAQVTTLSPELASVLASMRAGAYVCLDSNVWMTPACRPAIEAFMATLATEGLRLRLSGEQFDELDRLQTKGEQATRSLATRAKYAITSFAEAGSLMLMNTVDRTAHRDFDSYLVKQARGHLRAHRGLGRVVVVTDDVRLTGRLHSMRNELHRDADHVRVLDSRAFMRMLATAADGGR